MKARSTAQFLLLALMLGVIALATVPVSAVGSGDSRTWNRVSAAPTVTFSTTPRWEVIPGTRVALVSAAERPNYDLFRYGSTYYIYNDGNWYRSNQLNQTFGVIDESIVPIAISGVPNNQWRSYPPGWMNPKNPHYSGRHDNGKHKGQNQVKNKKYR